MTDAPVGIVGLGLIGGSIARDLAERGVRVVAVDPAADRIARALDSGVITGGGPRLDPLRAAEGVILATPPAATLALLSRLPTHVPRARWITDVCSTKVSVVRAAEAAGLAARFVGSHPLTGGTASGFDASRPGLFRDARVYLCEARGARPEVREAVETLWAALGAAPEWMDAAAHDRRLAWTSQLPQLVASALGLAEARAGVARAELGPGGRDTTRLAASSPDLWTEIAADSGPLLVEALDRFLAAAAEVREAVRDASGGSPGPEAGDAGGEALRRLLREARAWATDG